jgi:hypothetical protein
MTEGVNDRSYWELLEPYWSQLGNSHTTADFLAIVNAFPRPIILLYAAHFCQSEVRNGGLRQLFNNSSGVLAPEAIEGYHAIGMPLLAEVLQTAAATLGPDYPRERQERWHALRLASCRTSGEVEAARDKLLNAAPYNPSPIEPEVFKLLNKRFWTLANIENGGFEAAATDYALSVARSLIWPAPSQNQS